MELLNDRYASSILGVLTCLDRVVLTGTLPGACYAEGMTRYLYAHKIRIFDYPDFAKGFREIIRTQADALAKKHGIEIQFLINRSRRKESIVQDIIARRGNEPGLVAILSAMESCTSYKPWHNKATGKTYLKFDSGKCLHYYFYLIDEMLGLCYVRVPTWFPCRLQVYFNGHGWLSSKLNEAGIAFHTVDNAFSRIEDFMKAQELSDSIQIESLHKILDGFADTFCPIAHMFDTTYHWSVMQAENATDIVFKNQSSLTPIYEQLVSTAIHTVKVRNIATFLGHKLSPRYEQEMGNNCQVRIEGTRIKHTMGKASIKMYDKFGHILRIETTVNDLSFFKHYRKVEHRDGTESFENAPLKKNIYSLGMFFELSKASNRRYLEYISAIEDNHIGREKLFKVSERVTKNNRNYKGFNFFLQEDLKLLEVIARGEFNLSGFQNKYIRKFFPKKNTGQMGRMLARLRFHGLIKKIGKTYKYYLTQLGKQVVATGTKIKELVIIPELNCLRQE